MSAIDTVNQKGLPYHDDESGLIRLSILELSDSIKALTERVGVIDALFKKHVRECHPVDWREPFPGDNKFGPVLNDGKGTSDPGGQLPFVTGPLPDDEKEKS